VDCDVYPRDGLEKDRGRLVGGDEPEAAGGGNIRETRAFAWSVRCIREIVRDKKSRGDYGGGDKTEAAGRGNSRESCVSVGAQA
jgi:hypothetical protein